MVHPQKRIFIKKVLECSILRICELKSALILFNNRPKSIYVHLDQLLFDLKYDPSIIEIPIPRYFKEDDRIPVELKFKEEVERPGKKKKKKKKLKKKGKKKKDDEEKKEEPKMYLDEKLQLMDNLHQQYNKKGTLPEEEVVHDPFTLEINIHYGLRLIQKNDRGRQGIARVNTLIKKIEEAMHLKEMERKAKEGKMQRESEDNKENKACVYVQKRIRGILARKEVEKMRQEEMEFLGMCRRKKTAEEERNDPIKRMEEIRAQRKMTQEAHWKNYLAAKEQLKAEIDENEGTDLQEEMMKVRREWINEQRQMAGKIPDDIAKFYERFNVEAPLSPEEEAQKKLEEEEAAAKKKKKKAQKAKKKKGKKDKEEDPSKKAAKIQTTEVIRRFDEQYKEFNEDWVNRDETDNYKQEHDVAMAKLEVQPLLEEEYKQTVDDAIKIELANMKLLAGIKKKKGKKKGKKKKKKGGKKKKLKLPGYKQIADYNIKEVLVQLIQNNIVKKIPPQNLSDFIGEFNYCATMLDNIKYPVYDPSMALIRQLVTEYIIFPLGSQMVHERIPGWVKAFLFYGPQGTGKTLVVRACVHETNSIFFDLSPINIDGKYIGNKENEKLVASVMMVADEYQPSIIYIDECHKVWPGKKKKGKKKKGGAKKKKVDSQDPKRIKKAVKKWKERFLSEKKRITIIACTSEPENGSMKDFKNFFDKAVYFPFPDYTTRRLMWKTFIERCEGELRQDFPLSTLALISAGYSAGSILETCQKVLTKYRVNNQKNRPLALNEFIGPLSLRSNTMDDEYAGYVDFTDKLTGDDKMRKKLFAKEDDGKDGKKKKKGGKKKKK